MQDTQQMRVRSLGREDSLEQEMAVFLPGEFHGWRNLVGYSPWGHKESDMTERLITHARYTTLHRGIKFMMTGK